MPGCNARCAPHSINGILQKVTCGAEAESDMVAAWKWTFHLVNGRGGIMIRFLGVLFIVLLGFAPLRGIAATLISIQGVSIGADEYVEGFELVTDGVNVLAVCHVLGDWTVTVYNGGYPPDSHISGEAHHGASSLPVTELDRLKRLLLVEPDVDAAAKGAHPPSITGYLTLGLYGDGGHFRKLLLGPANIDWEPATGCR